MNQVQMLQRYLEARSHPPHPGWLVVSAVRRAAAGAVRWEVLRVQRVDGGMLGCGW